MQSWSAPEPVRLPGQGVPLRLFDTSGGQVRPLAPGRTARMYVCGITPYDSTHLGHAATYLTFDLVHRVLKDNGHQVDYVQNVTDVDDPLLARAVRDGDDWRVLAARETARFREDMAALEVLPPTRYLGVVEAIPLIVEVVTRLRDAGACYEIDGDLYFPVSAAPRFGEVAGQSPEAMVDLFAQCGGDPERPGKRDPLDALLWRRARPGEPCWDSDLGRGRPGWHVECVAIALDGLGMSFDIQGGGRDLAFPHHEMTAAHAEVATGRWPFARHYVHTGMIGLNGEKMSKSQGNLVFVGLLRSEGVDPSALRLALFAEHYRSDRMWDSGLLIKAQAQLDLWREAAGRSTGPAAGATRADVRKALADDLDTPRALAAVDRWATDAVGGFGSDARAPEEMVATVGSLLGVVL